MSGYDPSEEIADALDEVTAPAGRSVRVAPPPPPAITVVATGASMQPTASVVAPPSRASLAAGGATASERPASRSGRRTGPLLSQTPNEPGRGTTTMMPMPLLERLQQLRVDREVAGRPFRIVDAFNQALKALPSDPKELSNEFERLARQLNLGRRPIDEDFIPEGRFAVRILESAERDVAVRVQSLYRYLHRRIARKDIYAAALARLLEHAETGTSS